MSTMLAQIKEYFQDRGVTPADLPRVIITHEFFSVAFLALTWAACYQIQPSQSPVFAPINKALQESNNGFIVRSRHSFELFLDKAERRINHEWLSERGVDSGRVAISLAESTVFRKLAKPVTIPAKLWLTLKFVQGLDGMGNKGGRSRDGAKERRRKPTAAAAAAAADVDKGAKSSRGRRASGADGAVVAEQARGWWARGPAETGGGGGKGAPPSSSGTKGSRGWRGVRRTGRRKKAVCPPGRRGGGRAPGCFLAADFSPRGGVRKARPLW